MIVYYIIAAKVAEGAQAPAEGLVEGALEVGLEGAPEEHHLQTVVVTGPFPRDFFPHGKTAMQVEMKENRR